MSESPVRVEFAGATGEVVALSARPTGSGYIIDEASVDLPEVLPGDFVTAELKSGRLYFSGQHQQGPNRSCRFIVMDDLVDDIVDELSAAGAELEFHNDHIHVMCPESAVLTVDTILETRSELGEVEYSWYDALGDTAATLQVDSLESLARIFSALSHERVANPLGQCGHLHAWHVAGAIAALPEAPEDEGTPPFAELPAAFSRRIPVDIGEATLIDGRAVEALGELAAPYVSVLDLQVNLSHPSGEHRPAGLWIEAVLGIHADDERLETVALVDVPFDLHGSRLHLSESAGMGTTMWATRLDGHDPMTLCSYTATNEDEDSFVSPLTAALADTHELLRSALRDYAIVHLAQERDDLVAMLRAHHEH